VRDLSFRRTNYRSAITIKKFEKFAYVKVRNAVTDEGRQGRSLQSPEVDCSQRRTRMSLLSGCSHGAITLVRGRNVTYPGCWNRCTEFHAARHPDQNLTLSDLRGKPVIPGVLSRRLEPGLWRPDDALQRATPGVPQAGGGTIGHFGRGCGAMPPSPVTVTCISRCSPISNPRAMSRGCDSDLS
jgi:hypothetical protein